MPLQCLPRWFPPQVWKVQVSFGAVQIWAAPCVDCSFRTVSPLGCGTDFLLLTGAFFPVLYPVLTLLLCVVSLTSVGGTRSGDEDVKSMFLSSWAPLRARILWHPVEFQVTLLLQTSFNCAFSFGRGMSRGKVIRLRRRKQDNVSGEFEVIILIMVTFIFFLQDLCLLDAVII